MPRSIAPTALLTLLVASSASPDSAGAAAELTTIQGTIRRDATLASALSGYLPAAVVADLVEAARPLYDLARISAGRPFGITLGRDGLFRAFSYRIDELRTLRVVRRGERLQAEILKRDYETRTVVVSGSIESSLFAAAGAAGEGDQLALDLADVFAWDLDFNSEIRSGDAFRVAVEKQYLDYRMVHNGQFMDPLRVPLPRAEPIAPREHPAYRQSVRHWAALLAGAGGRTAARGR